MVRQYQFSIFFSVANFTAKQIEKHTKRGIDPCVTLRLWKCGLPESNEETSRQEKIKKERKGKKERTTVEGSANIRKRKSARSRNEKLKMRRRERRWQRKFVEKIREWRIHKKSKERTMSEKPKRETWRKNVRL